MKRILIAIVAMMFFPTLGYAESVYLSCYVDFSIVDKFSVVLDEGSGRVIHKTNEGEIFKTKGDFMPNEVTYKIFDGPKYYFRIDRSTMEVLRIIQYPDEDSPNYFGRGKCGFYKSEIESYN